MGQAIEEADLDPEAAFEKLRKESALPASSIIGYSYKAGKGIFLLGPSSFPLLSAAGWVTKVFGYHVEGEKAGEEMKKTSKGDDPPDNPQQHFQTVFEGLIKQGMNANEAAAKAILVIAGGATPATGTTSTTTTSTATTKVIIEDSICPSSYHDYDPKKPYMCVCICMQGLRFEYSERYGSRHADTIDWDDTDVILPHASPCQG